MWHQRYFFSAVALLGKDISYAFFLEGRNDFIRSITVAANEFMKKPADPESKNNTPNVNRERK